jgi:hypothetical protein
MTPRKLSLIVALLLILCVLGAALFVFKGELGDQIIDAYNLYKTEVIYHAKDTKQPSKSFRKFKNQNKDVEYILNVPGTNINYPVVGDPKKDNSLIGECLRTRLLECYLGEECLQSLVISFSHMQCLLQMF